MTKYHLIGIKGAGMSSLALLLHDYGYYVQGSDVEETFFTEVKLKEKNIKILPFNEENVSKDFIIIVGNAFINRNIEYEKALKLECEIYTYYEFLGILSKKFYSFAITGSHGKTTTSNIIRQVLQYDHTINYMIGDGQGGGCFESDLFVFEACEYQRHFLAYYPKIAVITNIDYDHPDYYKDIYDVLDAMRSFMNQASIIVYNGDDSLLKGNLPPNKQAISFGLNKTNQYYAENIHNDQNYTHYDLYIEGKYTCNISIPLFGIHSVYNSLAAIAACHFLIDDLTIIQKQLAKYQRSKRRFEEYKLNEQIVISDYAHHPKEIKATIEACQCKYPDKKIIIYFQPHTFTRTIALFDDFVQSLRLADRVYLREIFSSARENNKTISVNDLCNLIDNCSVINDNSYIEEFQKYKEAIILFMGAGDIDRYCDHYLEHFKNN